MHVKTERLAILVTSGQKRALVRRAKALDLSVAEFVCRLAEGFRPDADDQVLVALASELNQSAKESRGEQHREDLIASRLDKIYGPGGEESSLDREATLLQSRSLPHGR